MTHHMVQNRKNRRRAAVLTAGLVLLSLVACTPWYQAYGIKTEEDLLKLSAVPSLMLALKSETVSARVKAAETLREIGPDARDAAPDLVLALDDKHYAVRQAAADALDEIEPTGPEYKELPVQIQITRLNSKDWMVRRAAADKLAGMGPEAAMAVPALILALRDNSDWHDRYNEVRRAAVYALGEIGFDARAANPALIKTLESPDYDLRLEAVKALGKIGPKQTPDVIQALTGMLDDPDFDVRRESAVSLGNFENCAQCSLPFLVTASMSDQDYDVRREAVRAVCRISSDSNSSVCALVQALEDQDVEIRKEAIIALREASPETRQQLLPEIISRLNDIDESIRLNAVKTLASYGATCTPVCEALDRVAHEDQSLEVRLEAAETLYILKKLPMKKMPD